MTNGTIVRVLAVAPMSTHVGFAVLERPDRLIDWGTKWTRRADNDRAARMIGNLLDRFEPDILALEDWTAPGSRRCTRVKTLLARVATEAGNRATVRLVSLAEIRLIGPSAATVTKHARARFLAEQFPEIHRFLPRFRKIWMSQNPKMAIFDALSFALVCFAIQRDIT